MNNKQGVSERTPYVTIEHNNANVYCLELSCVDPSIDLCLLHVCCVNAHESFLFVQYAVEMRKHIYPSILHNTGRLLTICDNVMYINLESGVIRTNKWQIDKADENIRKFRGSSS